MPLDIPNTHVNSLRLRAAFTTLAFVVQVSCTAGRCMPGALSDTSVARRPRYVQRKEPRELQSYAVGSPRRRRRRYSRLGRRRKHLGESTYVRALILVPNEQIAESTYCKSRQQHQSDQASDHTGAKSEHCTACVASKCITRACRAGGRSNTKTARSGVFRGTPFRNQSD
jgi:hypothetical protein